jgi:hypothetical protein
LISKDFLAANGFIGYCFSPLEQDARVAEGGGRVVPVIEGRLRVP